MHSRAGPGARAKRAKYATALALIAGVLPAAAAPAGPPEIRLSERNRVPACVTPERLTRFLVGGNSDLKQQFRDIARYYKEHGEKLRVRWDYAFYQMIIETNYLKFINNAGKGDVSPKQNNFAGIGTTGGGVPGDSFADVSTGVLGQMQHLVAYSGERVASPVAPRTRDKQDDIIKKSLSLKRAPTFKDLAGRWAADRRYGTSIEFIASQFRAVNCNAREAPEIVTPAAREVMAKVERATDVGMPKAERGRHGNAERGTWSGSGGQTKRGASTVQAAALAEGKTGTTATSSAATRKATPLADRLPATCTVMTASYGGEKNVLIRAIKGSEMQYTALQVLDGQEQHLTAAFIRQHAAGGETLGAFESRDAALFKAFDLCPEAAVDIAR